MPPFESHASHEFWECYQQFALFLEDPRHPSLHLKPLGGFWSVRVSGSHRALAAREGNEFFWFWIGSHDEYERLIERP